MARSRLWRILPRGSVVIATCLFLAEPVLGGVGRQSSIVENYDHSGTTVVKVLPDAGQEWTIFNSWQKNEVNGAVRNDDGTSDFLNCTPQNRTNELLELACRLFDEGSQQWSGDPILVENSTSFLNGPYANPYNDLFEIPGQYTTTIEFPGFSESYRLQILNAAESSAGFPYLIVNTNPPVVQSFLFRNTDLTGGTPKLTNFTCGILTNDYCIDLNVTAIAPGGTLAGTFDVRENDGGECGANVVEDRSASLIPSGGAGVGGTYCEYTLNAIGTCTGGPGPTVGSSVCLPCAGTCQSFEGAVNAIFRATDPNPYPACQGLQVSPVAGQSCSRTCNGTRAMAVIAPIGG